MRSPCGSTGWVLVRFKITDPMEQTIDDKVVLIGHAGVGKSSLFTRFKYPDKFIEGDDVAITAQEAQHQKKYPNGTSVSGCCFRKSSYLASAITCRPTANLTTQLTIRCLFS